MSETWKPVVGFEGLYEVSDLGRVRSLDHDVLAKASAYRPASVRHYRGKVLRPGRNTSSGHVSVVLSNHTKASHQVHTLVLTAFVGPCPIGQEARHRNGVASDNRLLNLHWGTYGDNIRDVFDHGGRKVTADDVKLLRQKRARGATYKELSEEFGICSSHVGNVVHGRRYAHVE